MLSQNLIFDADDTLWENNVYYEAAIEGLIDLVDHPSLTRKQVRDVIDETERENIRRRGYGAEVFEDSLLNALCALRGSDTPDAAEVEKIAALCAGVHDMEMVLISGVESTLEMLSERHRLFLLTKGCEKEQLRKVEKSGLAGYFAEAVVVPEKDVSAYRSFSAARNLPVEHTWMIGNSLRSDINPALACGLGAVFVPHPMTWSLEADRVPDPSPRFLTVPRFGALGDHF